MAAIFDYNGSGRLGGGRNLYQGDGQKKREGVHYNSKSNMASQMNDRELITLARPNETPAGWFSSYRSFLKSTISNY